MLLARSVNHKSHHSCIWHYVRCMNEPINVEFITALHLSSNYNLLLILNHWNCRHCRYSCSVVHIYLWGTDIINGCLTWRADLEKKCIFNHAVITHTTYVKKWDCGFLISIPNCSLQQCALQYKSALQFLPNIRLLPQQAGKTEALLPFVIPHGFCSFKLALWFYCLLALQ